MQASPFQGIPPHLSHSCPGSDVQNSDKMSNTVWEISNNSFPLFPVLMNTPSAPKECLGLGFFFPNSKAKNLSWPLHVETSGQQKKFKQFGLEVLSKMGNFCLPSGNFFNKSKLIKSLGKYSPENAVSAVLPPYLHALPLPTTLLSWEQWVLPPEQWKGTGRTQHNSFCVKRGIDSLQIQQWVFHTPFHHTLSISAHQGKIGEIP